MFSIVAFVYQIVFIVISLLGIYLLVILILLGHKGIKALNIYIEKNKDKEEEQ